MDNQNANKGGVSQNSNPPQDQGNQEQQVASREHTLENVRTRSVIVTSRELAEKELASQEAYNQQVLHNQRVAARRENGMRAAIKIMMVVFGLIILVALGWLIVEIVKSLQGPISDGCRDSDGKIVASCCDRPEYKGYVECKEEAGKHATIDGYQCLTDKCKKMTDIIKDERIVIYDTKFYIYDIKKNTSTLMTIDESIEYSNMYSFEWGNGNYYIILQPMTGGLGLYSVSANTQIIANTITSFYTDIKGAAYSGMTDILGKYIIARESNQYRLYDVITGTRVASGTEGIYVYQKYAMTIDGGGVRRVLNLNGNELFVAQVGEEIFIRDNYVFLVGKTLTGYDSAGTKLTVSNNALMKEITKVKASNRISYLKDAKNKYYCMPLTRNYGN